MESERLGRGQGQGRRASTEGWKAEGGTGSRKILKLRVLGRIYMGGNGVRMTKNSYNNMDEGIGSLMEAQTDRQTDVQTNIQRDGRSEGRALGRWLGL